MEILNKDDMTAVNEYESFVSGKNNVSFMQSLQWRNVKSNWNNEAIVTRDCNGKITGACLVLIKEIPFC